MSFFGRSRSSNRARVDLPAATGPGTGFMENAEAAYETTRLVDSAFGFDVRLAEMYRENLRVLGEELGGAVDAPTFVAVGAYANIVDGRTARPPAMSDDSGSRLPSDRLAAAVENYDKIEELVRQRQAAGSTRVKSIRQLIQALRSEARETEQRFADVNLRATFFGDVGAFGGAAVGSMTLADPQNLITLGVGGWGAKAVTRILTESAAAGGIEGASTFALSARNRDRLGVDPLTLQEQISQALFAAAGAGAIRGGVEGLGPAARGAAFVRDRAAPGRAFGRAMEQALETADIPSTMPPPAAIARAAMDTINRITPDTVARAAVLDDILARVPQDDVIRSAREALRFEVELERLNPYGLSPQARAAHLRAVRAVTTELAESLQPGSRPLPRPLVQGVEFAPVDTNAVESTPFPADGGRVRADVVNAAARETALRNEVSNLRTELDLLSAGQLGPAPIRGGRSLRAEIRAAEARAREAEAKVDALRMRNLTVPVDMLDVAREARQARDGLVERLRGQTADADERDIQALRRQWARAKRNLARATDLRAAAEKVRAQTLGARLLDDLAPRARFSDAARSAIRDILARQEGAVRVTGSGVALPLRPPGAEITAGETARAARGAIADATRAPEVEKMVEAAPDRMEASVDEDAGTVDLGLDDAVDLDSRIILDAETGESVSLSEMLHDFRDDQALAKAMTECAI